MMQILLLVAAYGAFKIIREIVGNTSHLTDEEIENYKYHRRSLSSAKQRRVTNHIGICDECSKRFTDAMMGDLND